MKDPAQRDVIANMENMTDRFAAPMERFIRVYVNWNVQLKNIPAWACVPVPQNQLFAQVTVLMWAIAF